MASLPVLELGPNAITRRAWLSAIWDHGAVLGILARKDFQVRYKRATFGVLWAVAVPLVQAAALAFIFSRLVDLPGRAPFGPFVFSGILAWSYFATTMQASVSSIVDASGLTDKVWFPRALLPIVPCLANLVGLTVSMAALVVIVPMLGGSLTFWLLMLVPATALLVALTVALSLVLSALDVYFRDVKFLTSAALLVWLYVTPIVYSQDSLGGAGRWLDFNPLTGVILLFHVAVQGPIEPLARALVVTAVTTVVLLVVGIEAQRRHDRLFVDLL